MSRKKDKTFRLLSRQTTTDMGVMVLGNPAEKGATTEFYFGEEGYYCAEVDASCAAAWAAMNQTTIHVQASGEEFPWEVKDFDLLTLKQIAKIPHENLLPLLRRHADSPDYEVSVFAKDMVLRLEGLKATGGENSPFAGKNAAIPKEEKPIPTSTKPAAKKGSGGAAKKNAAKKGSGKKQ